MQMNVSTLMEFTLHVLRSSNENVHPIESLFRCCFPCICLYQNPFGFPVSCLFPSGYRINLSLFVKMISVMMQVLIYLLTIEAVRGVDLQPKESMW